ncbi:unnamed protein product [Protopolystoma xenopodis]|uniref:Uncharacterized protein n=1 Tax=Protopolystoma xenopodis TaxID=117903 RepID=A0A448X126_9PLAT|nr:unnamed protein product [Protopolystoma xenopodis]
MVLADDQTLHSIDSVKPYPVDHSYQNLLNQTDDQDPSTWNIVKATQFGALRRVVTLVETGDPELSLGPYDVNQLDKEDVSLLHWAAINNRLSIMLFFLGKGAQIDRRGGNLAATPLHWAIRQSHVHAVALLLKHGADPNIRDNTGLSCIHAAIQTSCTPVIAYLLARGVDIDCRDEQGVTPLMLACMHCKGTDPLRLLLAWGADVTLSDSRGNSVAHYAVKFINPTAIVQLDRAGVDWTSINKIGQTAYEVRQVPWLNDKIRQMAYKRGQSKHPRSNLTFSIA